MKSLRRMKLRTLRRNNPKNDLRGNAKDAAANVGEGPPSSWPRGIITAAKSTSASSNEPWLRISKTFLSISDGSRSYSAMFGYLQGYEVRCSKGMPGDVLRI
jgi:hypothetical protein